MHTIPDKLNALRQSIEAAQIRHNAELRQEYEKKLKEVTAASEEAAFNRAVDLIMPKISASDQKLEDELPKMRDAMAEVVKTCNASASAVRTDVSTKVQDLQVEVAGLRVELPPLRKHIKENSDFTQRLSSFHPEIKEAVTQMQRDMNDQYREMTIKLGEERKRAEVAEEILQQQIKDNHEKASSGVQALTERSREGAAKAIDHAECIQDRLLCQLDEVSRKASEEVKKSAAEVSATIEPAIKKAIDDVLCKVGEVNYRADDLVAASEKALREDFKTIVADVSAAFENSTELKAAELSVSMAENMEEVRRQIETARDSDRKSLDEAIAEAFVQTKELRATLDARGAELEAAISEGTRALQESAEANVKKFSDRHEHFEESLGVLALDGQEVRAEHRKIEQQLRDDMRLELNAAVAKLEKQTKDTGQGCDTRAAHIAAHLGQQLREETATGLGDVNQRLDTLTSNTDAMVTEEKETRRSALAELEARRVRELHDCSVDLQAALASATAEASARNDGTNRRVDALGDKFLKLGEGLESQSTSSASAVSRLQSQTKQDRDELEAAYKDLRQKQAESSRLAADEMRKQASDIGQEIALSRSAASEDLAEVQKLLPSFATKEEVTVVDGVAKAAFTLSNETASRVNVFESTVDRQRAWFEDQSRDLAVRCHDAQSDASDAKFRMQRETSTLGAEISLLRGAATSLTRGVIKSLQLVGLLGDELEVLPPKASDGSTPLMPRRWGVDVADLLEWEKSGQDLASKLVKQWQSFEKAGLPNMLTLVERKANEADLRMLRASVNNAIRASSPKFQRASSSLEEQEGKPWSPTSGAEHKPWTPSTAVSMSSPNDFGNATMSSPNEFAPPSSSRSMHEFMGAGREITPSPPLGEPGPGGPRRPHTRA